MSEYLKFCNYQKSFKPVTDPNMYESGEETIENFDDYCKKRKKLLDDFEKLKNKN